MVFRAVDSGIAGYRGLGGSERALVVSCELSRWRAVRSPTQVEVYKVPLLFEKKPGPAQGDQATQATSVIVASRVVRLEKGKEWIVKKPRKESPTERTLKALREGGHEADVVERWIGGKFKVRKDLFGMFDILCLREGRLVGIQCTNGGDGHHANRKAKLLANEILPKWLACGCQAEVWSWYKYAERVDGRWWRARIEPITNLEN